MLQILNFSVPATYKTSRNVVIVKPNWLGSGYERNLYFSLRVNVSGRDSRLICVGSGVDDH